MKCRIIWFGKTREPWIKAGITEYRERVGRYLPLIIEELKDEKDAEAAEGRRREGERLLKQLPSNAVLVVLDERGRQLDSVQFAELIGKQRDSGTPELIFVIGGAYGFSDEIRKRAGQIGRAHV